MLSTLQKAAKKYKKLVSKGSSSTEKKKQSEKEFAELVSRFCGIESNLKKFHTDVEDYVNAVKEVCTLQANLAGDLLYFFDAKSSNRKYAEGYHQTASKMHHQNWTELARVLQESVLDPLKEHLMAFPTVHEMVKKRKRKLMDVETYKRQVLYLARTGRTKNVEKFRKKSEKLSQAEALFYRMHHDLVEIFESYETSREVLLVNFTSRIMMSQAKFLQNSNADMRPLKEVAEEFKGDTKNKTMQMVKRLEDMVNLFKDGEYATDAAPLVTATEKFELNPLQETKELKSHSPASRGHARSTTRGKKFNFHLNPPFDTKLPFEVRHRMYAPSDQDYAASKSSDLSDKKLEAISHRPSRSLLLKLDDMEEAVYSFVANNTGELSFQKGEIIKVMKRSPDGWW
eukprot:CAMPEP_0167744806 /NCGR_PEP_ID=MMETSP0110_2-20121227/2797_1 /TAXON_ID=629695 /ORGANISM="Gymnochlora sp., Strain CCMP2014" /LENGTH=398 /DNA_ID=CAMNT_0007629371 /DNA_START=29 /DNA_END=1222 /DNA_ORIENTATION=-